MESKAAVVRKEYAPGADTVNLNWLKLTSVPIPDRPDRSSSGRLKMAAPVVSPVMVWMESAWAVDAKAQKARASSVDFRSMVIPF
ncbi:hypothetical protein EJB06_23665 [Massilia atriviolacea]|uniref:Uncharacterized protein n=1 Tax=Massilia atriviolacea TaxID=2495579 RepID=A0A430HGJ1_9BURK|nr:hypothetical protein EJB06_23665 [Massilia atriviolacea]